MARTAKTSTSVACRGCWRTDQREVFRLRCDHVFCASCLANRARVAMNAPANLLPLRCCELPVPAAVLVSVLHASELAFYGYLTAHDVERKKQLAITGATALAAACDFCGRFTELSAAAPGDHLDRLLPCGHVYCDECDAGLREASKDGDPVCCKEMPRSAAIASSALTLMSTSQAARGSVDAAAAPVVAPAKGKGKGKRKAPRAAVPDLLGDARSLEDVCAACSTVLTGTDTAVLLPCGHTYCRACVQQRCKRAVVNEDQGSIGVPMRCCHQLVPVDLLRPVLSLRLQAKYEALVAKRADAVAAMPTRVTKRKTQVATPAIQPPQTKRLRSEAPTTNADTNALAPTPDTTASQPKAECVSCMTDVVAVGDRLSGPCGHVYCLSCLSTMARLSLDDRSLVPIRCCGQEFPIDYVRRMLPKTKMTKYERFVREKDWRTSDLKSDQEYARVVKKVRGKQCPACGIGVQKQSGCSTMYCPHGHTFCWTCAASPCVCHTAGRA